MYVILNNLKMKDRKKISVLVIGVVIALVSCNVKNTENKSSKTKEQIKEMGADNELSKGFQILESNCFSCHSPNASIENKVAPSMIAIKKHYITEEVTKEDFIKALIEFINTPSEENPKIPGAIKRFGVMPKMSFSDKQLTQVAGYIYDTELEAPDWFEKHYQEEKKKHMANMDLADLSYEELGLKYAMSTKAVLGKNLMGAIKSKGTENALEFCNIKAFLLTDSMANVLKTKIKRVSDKPRNPLNAANESELKYIDVSKQILAKRGKIKPQVQEINGKMVSYYPIITNKMCMQCHGEPNTQIQPATLEKLNSLYPKDMAKGYAENQLRGIWVVEMDKKYRVTEKDTK